MSRTTVGLTLEPLTAQAWAPFGWLPVSDEDPADGQNTLTFQWQDPHVNLIHHSADEIDYVDGSLACDRMFRHLTHTQTLLVLDAASAIAVAPAGTEFSSPADLELIAAFRLDVGDALVLNQGTWHWGPFPLTDPRVDMFNVQGRRYAQDNDCRVLTDLGTVLCHPNT